MRLGSGEPLRRGESQGSPRPTLLANCTPRSKSLRGSLEMGRPCRRPSPLPCRAGVRMLDPRVQQLKRGRGAELPTRHLGVPCSGHPEKPQERAQGAALTLSPDLSLRTSNLGFESRLQGCHLPSGVSSSPPGLATPCRTRCLTHARQEGDPSGRPFQAPPCKQTLQGSPHPPPQAGSGAMGGALPL